MAALARVTGRIGYINKLEGISKTSGQPYSMQIATVLVADRGVAEITLPRPESIGGRVFAEGESVDLLVSFDVYGNRISSTVVGDYPKHLREAEADALTFSGNPAESLV